jgi:hypothetical protein
MIHAALNKRRSVNVSKQILVGEEQAAKILHHPDRVAALGNLGEAEAREAGR